MARNRDPFASALRTLRERVIAGAFSPGRPIIILDEAQALGLSTTPVREALAWLGGEGLIDRAPAGGYAGLRLDAIGLASRYRLRLHCLEAGLRVAREQASPVSPLASDDLARLFRSLATASADPVLLATYDRVQSAIDRFSDAEATLVGDMPAAIAEIDQALLAENIPAALEGLRAFHQRRINLAHLITEGENLQPGAG